MSMKFGLSVYGPQKVEFTKLLDNSSNELQLKDLLYAGIFHKAKQGGDPRKWKPLANRGVFNKVVSKFEHSNSGYGFYCFMNYSNKTIEVKLTMTKQKNVQFCKKIKIIFK